MAALIFLACNAIQQLYDFTNAFVRTGFDIRKSFHHIRTRQRLQLFQRYSRELWLAEFNRYVNVLKVIDVPQSAKIEYTFPVGISAFKEVLNIAVASALSAEEELIVHQERPTSSGKIMQRNRRHVVDGIDFAKIEASSEAYEAPTSTATSSAVDVNDFLAMERHYFDEVDNYDDIEVINGVEVDTTFLDYIETLPVYQNDNIGQLVEGASFTITGDILLTCERFSINFLLDNDAKDVALHINPRLPQNYIVRNTKTKNVWGREEVSSALPFSLHRGAKFSIQVLVTTGCYMISVNGNHFAEYNHRLPYTAVAAIEVKGDVENVQMERIDATHYPERLPESEAKNIRITSSIALAQESPGANDDSGMDEGPDFDEVDGTNIPREWRMIDKQGRNTMVQSSPSFSNYAGLSLPYYGVLPPKSLFAGRCLRIEGRVKLLPHSFYINLQQGQNIWPHPIIAFHFNPRFSKQSGAIGKAIVCRNAWHNGAWEQEERSLLDTDFRPGKTFSMAIVCNTDAFEVYVNRKLITEFKYRVQPNIVDTVYIQGDIKLWDVILENNSTVNGNKRIYNNPICADD